jgi:hypothetical protein
MAHSLAAEPSARFTRGRAQSLTVLRGVAVSLALGVLALAPWPAVGARPIGPGPLADVPSGWNAFERLPAAASPLDEAPVVYLVGSEPEAAWVRQYVVDGLVRRELPAGSRVLVVGRDADAAPGLAMLRRETGRAELQIIDLRTP